MANYIPFNFNPSSVAVKTSSDNTYTVPAGFYAYVQVNLNQDGTFDIDSVQAMTNNQFVRTLTDVNTASDTNIYQGTNDTSIVDVYVICGGTYTVEYRDADNDPAIALLSGVTGSQRITDLKVTSDDKITIVPVGSQSMKAIVAGNYMSDSQNYGTFWVPTGTDLDVANGKYTVSLFAIP